MLSTCVLAFVTLIPSLVVAGRFRFGGCNGNFNNDLDALSHTQQGIGIWETFSAKGTAKVYLWDPNSEEEDFTSMQFRTTWNTGKYTLTYTNGGALVTTTGDFEYQLQPKVALLLTASDIDRNGIFGFNNDGAADLYPLYISETDIVLKGCTDAFLGRVEAMYVLTHNVYTILDQDCAIQDIATRFGWTPRAHTQ